MLIGEKSAFAVEWKLISQIEGFRYVNFQFWVDNQPLGTLFEEAVLGVILHSANVFLDFKGKRYLPEADFMSSEDLWQYIEEYANSDDPEKLKISIAENYRIKFLVHEIAIDTVGTMSHVIMAENFDGDQRLLWKYRESSKINEKKLRKFFLDEAIESFIRLAE